jgi:hypothetical protein
VGGARRFLSEFFTEFKSLRNPLELSCLHSARPPKPHFSVGEPYKTIMANISATNCQCFKPMIFNRLDIYAASQLSLHFPAHNVLPKDVGDYCHFQECGGKNLTSCQLGEFGRTKNNNE